MQIKHTLLILLFLISLTETTYAQSFNVNSLFNPGITVGSEFVPKSPKESASDFQLMKHQAQFILPLKTKLGIKGISLKDFNLKKVNVKASQLFFTFKGNIIDASQNGRDNFNTIYGTDIGFSAITVSTKRGIWTYSANVFFLESSSSIKTSPNPNFRGHIVKVKIKNLNFIYFYGVSLIVYQGKVFPAPIAGFRKKLASKWRTSVIFPVKAELTYKSNKKLLLNLGLNLDGLNTISRNGSALKGNDNSINYSQIKSYVGVNAKLNKHFTLVSELGYSSFREVNYLNADPSTSIDPSPYINISINYHFGKSVFDNFIDKAQ